MSEYDEPFDTEEDNYEEDNEAESASTTNPSPKNGPTLPSYLKLEMLQLGSMLDIGHFDMENMTELECSHYFGSVMREIDKLKHAAAGAAGGAPSNGVASKKEKAILLKTKSLENEFKVSLNSIEDMETLRSKLATLMQQNKKEKNQRVILEQFIESQNKKLNILVEHIEKLMKALKIESGKRSKSLEATRSLQKQHQALKDKLDRQFAAINTQQRFIAELSEGSKILEDQLKLMDEKYLSMRSKMDVSRDYFSGQIAKVKKESETLRMKYSLANKGQLLDSVKLPAGMSMEQIQRQQQQQQQGVGAFTQTLQRSDSFNRASVASPAFPAAHASVHFARTPGPQSPDAALLDTPLNARPHSALASSTGPIGGGVHARSSLVTGTGGGSGNRPNTAASQHSSSDKDLNALVDKISAKATRKKSVWTTDQLRMLAKS